MSDNISENLYNKYIKHSNSPQIISVIGKWGCGKSTVREEINRLIKKDPDNKSKNVSLINFEAYQFEENSQVTSSLYRTIANNIRTKKGTFRAISYLKKETTANSISMSIILSIFIIGFGSFLLNKISKVEELNNWLTFHFSCSYLQVDNPSLWNKLIIGVILLSLFIWKSNSLVVFTSAFLIPNNSHIDILKKIQLKDDNIYLFIDEIDRLSPLSIKLLLDETLIIKENLTNVNLLKIILFYDSEIIINSLEINNIKRPQYYLQKYSEARFEIHKATMNDKLIEIMPKYFKDIKIESKFLALVIDNIDKQLTSYRDFDRLIEYISLYCNVAINNLEQSKFFSYIHSINNSKFNSLLDIVKLLLISDQYFFSLKNISALSPSESPLLAYKDVFNEEIIKIKQEVFFNNNFNQNKLLSIVEYFTRKKQEIDLQVNHLELLTEATSMLLNSSHKEKIDSNWFELFVGYSDLFNILTSEDHTKEKFNKISLLQKSLPEPNREENEIIKNCYINIVDNDFINKWNSDTSLEKLQTVINFINKLDSHNNDNYNINTFKENLEYYIDNCDIFTSSEIIKSLEYLYSVCDKHIFFNYQYYSNKTGEKIINLSQNTTIDIANLDSDNEDSYRCNEKNDISITFINGTVVCQSPMFNKDTNVLNLSFGDIIKVLKENTSTVYITIM